MPAALISRDDAVARLGDVFREHGFEGASLTAITAATGLGKGSLYNYFPGGKDEMAAAVLAHVDGWFEREIYAPLREAGDVPAAIAAMFDNTDRYFRGGGRICLVGAFALDATRDRFAAAVQDYFRRWIDALAKALEQGGARQPVALAEAAVGGIQGALVLARALNEPAAFRRQIDRLQAMLLSALA
ncbi:TetR/AcrR family transcriptional regulator [Ferrovibrio sp.]|uniref:TetR/AcrR family transcriptional regulator n=1 Tax=Ferrovibrio sp. TaxID=1917215 RepID=UPI00351830C3